MAEKRLITLTEKAILKTLELFSQQENADKILGLRVSVIGGGCVGFQYHLEPALEAGPLDKILEFSTLKVFVDQASALFLEGTTIDYVETFEGAGFTFENPNARRQCGCGLSFNA
jgi:iron-sulfur cluster assembly protein